MLRKAWVAPLVAAAFVVGILIGRHDRRNEPVLVYAVPDEAVLSSDPAHTIWRADADGSHPVPIARGDSPVISPDGHWIAYEPAQGEIAVMTSRGDEAHVVVRADWAHIVRWAPDSRWLLVTDSDGLVRIDRSTGRRRLLVRFAGRRLEGIEGASIAPDGRTVVYALDGAFGSDLYAVAANGGRARRLTHDLRSFSPLHAPNGSIVFSRADRQRWDLWRMNGDGSALARVTHVRTAIYPVAWSDDGRRLLAATPAMHNGRLWAIELPAGRVRALTPLVGDLFAQGLSRDGRTVLAAIGCGGMAALRGVVETIPFGGGSAHVVADGPCRASWNA